MGFGHTSSHRWVVNTPYLFPIPVPLLIYPLALPLIHTSPTLNPLPPQLRKKHGLPGCELKIAYEHMDEKFGKQWNFMKAYQDMVDSVRANFRRFSLPGYG
jgi:hypothetical protein